MTEQLDVKLYQKTKALLPVIEESLNTWTQNYLCKKILCLLPF